MSHAMNDASIETTPAGPTAPKSRRAWRSFRRGAVRTFAVIGAASVVFTIVGGAYDISNFDHTRGGYTAPYTDYTGTPINWNSGDVTPVGFRRPGIVINTNLNCDTGMISFTIWGMTFNYRTLSQRALVVHKPIQACEAHGFHPHFTPTPGA
jgi:hypothetical protein